MKQASIALAFVAISAQAAEFAAPVTGVIPQYREVTVTRNVCVTETVIPGNSDGSALGGAVIGGAIGSAVSGKGDKTLGAGIGAVIGGIVGDNVGRQPVTQQRCHPEHTLEQRPAGYRVTYRIGNREFTQVMDRNPGNYVSVTVTAR